jgi:acyl-CoA synthetase (AMP-forming)/AMP-acid ligase II
MRDGDLHDRRAPPGPMSLDRSRRLVVPEFLRRSAQRVPDTAAIIFAGRTLTFAELEQRVNRLAGGLATRGVGAGDRVAILMVNRPEFVECFLAAHTLGAAAVPINFRLKPDEVAYQLAHSGARAIIADAELTDAAAGAPVPVRIVAGARFPPPEWDTYDALLAAGQADAPAGPGPDDEDLSFLMYTSGTTGRPKAAMLSHQNLVANTLHWIIELRASADDVWLAGLPLFHIGGLNGILPFLALGATSVIEPSTGFDPARSIELLRANAVTMCFFVPTQWQQICTHPDVVQLRDTPLRTAMWGASGSPRATLELMSHTLPGVEIVSSFGQTEMSSNTTLLKGVDAVRKLGSVGRPLFGVQVRIVDETGADVAPGEVGEIVYRGPTVMHGYLDDPEASAEAFAGGWFHSGDLVRADDEGYVYVVDRKKDMIISGGENVYPAEVERVLAGHPAVAEVAVLGIAHERWVETPLAVVVLAPGAAAGEDELIAYCAGRLAGYKKPTAVRFAAALPRNAAGKVLKRDLRGRYGSPAPGTSTPTV